MPPKKKADPAGAKKKTNPAGAKKKTDPAGAKKMPEPIEPEITQTEKELFNLEVAALNNKIVRLRASIDAYENENLRLQEAYEKLDQDRNDVISFLKKSLAVKTEELHELKQKVKGLEETRIIETANFKQQIAELEKNFDFMKGQLGAENKLLSGKLNTLDEFRAIRDDLMAKYEQQERNIAEQEFKYKRIVYNAEKKLIINKDQLKKDMEKRLLQLAIDYQDASEVRIAASTHRVMRENIAINRELDFILQSQDKLCKMIEKYKESARAARIAQDLAEEERDTAISKSVTQLKVIKDLTSSVIAMKQQYAFQEKDKYDMEKMEKKLNQLNTKNTELSKKIQILELKLHETENTEYHTKVEAGQIISENNKLKRIIREATYSLQAVFKFEQMITVERTQEMKDMKYLLDKLDHILAQYHVEIGTESMESLISFDALYKKGDLGFVPMAKAKAKAAAPKTSKLIRKKLSVSSPDKKSVDTQSSVPTNADTVDMVSFSGSSLETLPSLKLVPFDETKHTEKKMESIVSLVRLSVSEYDEEEEDKDDVEDVTTMLNKSKIAVQKSAFKDLAVSQSRHESLSRSEIGSRIGGFKMSEEVIGEMNEIDDGKEAETEEDGKGEAADDAGDEEESKAKEGAAVDDAGGEEETNAKDTKPEKPGEP